MARKKAKRYFGSVRQLKSGRYQARYTGPDGLTYNAPVTFDTKGDAEAWLSIRHSEILRGAWLPPKQDEQPKAKPITVQEYCDAWLTDRDLKTTTRDHYRQLLDDHIYPTFKDVAVVDVKPAAVRAWHAQLARGDGKKVKDRPTARAHTYGLLRTIMHTAVAEEVIPANPCRVRGAGQSKRAKQIEPASLAELEVLVTAMPKRLQLMVLLAAWCALRFGELAEIRRNDVDVKNLVVHVRRGVTRTKGRMIVDDPKSEAGKRPVNIPPHLKPLLLQHLHEHMAVAGRDALLFPSAGNANHQLSPSTLYKSYYPARDAAGRSDLRFHDLRHTGAVLAAAEGATLAELMARLGHSTVGAAMRYQHASQERDKILAAKLSERALGTVTPIETARKEKDHG